MFGRGGRGVSVRPSGATGANNVPVSGGASFGNPPQGSQPNAAGDAQGGFGDKQQTDAQPQAGGFGQQAQTGFGQQANAQQPSGGFGQQAQTGFGQDAPAQQQFGGRGGSHTGRGGFNQGAPAQQQFSGRGGSQTARGGFSQGQSSDQQQQQPANRGGFNQRGAPSGFGQRPGGQENNQREERQPREGADRPERPERIGRIGGYVPKDRDLSDIQHEDELSKPLYSTIFQQDEEILVSGVGDEVSCLDKWTDFDLNENVLKNVQTAGYVLPRKIQAYSIPLILEGYDLKAQAETGSGKSAAFLIPLIHKIVEDKKKATLTGPKNKPFALIMEPTRELTLQLYEQARKLAHQTGVQVVKCYGQYDQTSNGREILQGSDIIVGTPGRMLDFVSNGTIDVSQLKYFVLDEADRLIASDDFLDIVKQIRGVSTYPKGDTVQNLLFSATFSPQIEALAGSLMKPKCAFIHNKFTVAANSKVSQIFVECPGNEKKLKVLEILNKELQAAKEKDPNAKMPRTLVFCQKRSDADLMALFLSDAGISSTTINGDRPQKERERALDSFRANLTPVLCATDVCARGIDVKDLDFVINMDLPLMNPLADKVATYIHRIGRTGRLKEGKALSFFDVNSDQELAAELIKLLEAGKNTTVPQFLRDAAAAPPPMTGNSFGGGNNTGGFGAGANKTGGFGAGNTGGFGAGNKTGGFGTGNNTGGFGAGNRTGGFGANAAPTTGGFGSAPTTGGFNSAPTGGFGSAPTTGGFGAQKTAGFGQ